MCLQTYYKFLFIYHQVSQQNGHKKHKNDQSNHCHVVIRVRYDFISNCWDKNIIIVDFADHHI